MFQQSPARAELTRVASPPRDRRHHDRHTTTEDQAWLGWWEGRLYRKSPATLLDLSHGGAKLITEFPPPRRSTVWICLDGPHRTEWVEAEIVAVSRLQDQTALVRVAFREVCPYTFFDAAVYGHHETTAETSAGAVITAAAHRVGW